MNFLDLPNLMLIEIFEYLSYDEVSKKRLVCRRFDQISQHVLNCGFNKVIRQHAINLKRIKALLPRRESERRNHYLARHADILTSIETRISMLSMTYSKYIELKVCCFIPGRVLDEIFSILRMISKTTRPLRPHEVLQELRDISSMAIEHFDEKIASTLKKSFAENNVKGDNSRMASTTHINGIPFTMTTNPSDWQSSHLSLTSPRYFNSTFKGTRYESAREPTIPESLNLELSNLLDVINRSTKNSKTKLDNGTLDDEQSEPECSQARLSLLHYKKLKLENKHITLKIHRMQQLQSLQARRLQQALTTIAEQNSQVIELRKRVEELDAKNREISANIKQINCGESTTLNDTNSNTAEESTVSSSNVTLAKNSENINSNAISLTSGRKRNYEDDIASTSTGASKCSKVLLSSKSGLTSNNSAVNPAKKQKV